MAAFEDIPDRSRGSAFQDQKQPLLHRGRLTIRFCQLMFRLSTSAPHEQGLVRSRPSAQPMPKLARPLLQTSIMEILIRAVELSLPQAEACRAAGKTKVGIQDNPVQTIVLALQQISISAAQSVGHGYLIVAEPLFSF